MKILSIAISAYNKEKYLERCIHSLLCKNLQYIEVIIVNDGSIDKTSQIAHNFEKLYPNSIIVIDKENGHQGSCINKAIEVASGKYFKMLDADDYFSTDILDYVISQLKIIDVDMLVTGHIIDRKPPISITPINVKDNFIYNQNEVDFSTLGMPNCLGMHGVAFKTQILKDNNIRLTENCSFSDAEYCYYPLKYCKTTYFIIRNLYIYQTEIEGQESSLKSEKVKNDAYRICERMIKDYITFSHTTPPIIKHNEEIIIERCLSAYFSLSLLHFKTNKNENSRINQLLEICKTHCPNVYKRIINIHTKKIPFVFIYKYTKQSSYYIYRLFNFIQNFGQ